MVHSGVVARINAPLMGVVLCRPKNVARLNAVNPSRPRPIKTTRLFFTVLRRNLPARPKISTSNRVEIEKRSMEALMGAMLLMM
ncbi:hypothetical protein D9M69_562990 [compost metagenome]